MMSPHEKTVLVVEDEVLIRMSIAHYLRAGGWRVIEAGTGDAARSLFLDGELIDVVFSDVQMPGAMDGVGLAHWVHDHHPEVHFLLTSNVAAMDGIPTQVCPQASIFRKPYEDAAIAAQIHALLG